MDGSPPACRLCSGPTESKFQLEILAKYKVSYFECRDCGSLESQRPYWLDETYANPSDGLDVGRAQRVVMTSLISAYILERLGTPKERISIDWGGADGLFTRLMRDRGFSFLSYDKYQKSSFAEHFSVGDPGSVKPAAVTMFEVFEHLADPGTELGEVFSLKPDVLIFTTEPYKGQGPDWTYLVPRNGKHVFFYSGKALEWIAERYQYALAWFGMVGVYASQELLRGDEAGDGWRGLREGIASLVPDAALSFARHLSGEPWKHVQSDHQKVTRKLSGEGPGNTEAK